MDHKRGFGIAVTAVALCITTAVQAAGFYISEIGTPGSLGTAGVANPVNDLSADASWTNPAGMTGLQNDEILAGGQVILPSIKFDSSIAEAGGDDGGNAGNAAFIPSFFMVKKLSQRWRAGFSVVAPIGGAMNYGEDFVGRYAATRVALQAVGGSPSIAYEVNDRFSLGAGVSIVYTLFEQRIAVNQSALGAPDGAIKFDNMDDIGYQPFVGMTLDLSDRLFFGAVYRAEMDVDLKGDLNFRDLAVPAPPANTLEIAWDNPQTVKAGLRYSIDDSRRLIVSANWEDWSEFSDNQLTVSQGALNPATVLDRKFKDTWSVGVAFVNLTGRGHGYSFGASYDSSPVSDSNRTIDLPFDETYKLSAAYAWKGPRKLDFGLGGTLFYLGEGKTDQTAQGVRFKGKFDRNLMMFLGATVRYDF